MREAESDETFYKVRSKEGVDERSCGVVLKGLPQVPTGKGQKTPCHSTSRTIKMKDGAHQTKWNVLNILRRYPPTGGQNGEEEKERKKG